MMTKKDLYNRVMANVSKTVKKAINESVEDNVETTCTYTNDLAVDRDMLPVLNQIVSYAYTYKCKLSIDCDTINGWPEVTITGPCSAVRRIVKKYWGEDEIENIM